MAAVVGIGGVFFRARDPEALGRWYEEHLGVTPGAPPWSQQAGPTVFAPFPADTDYFARPQQTFMLNFRVDDLDAIVTRLRAAGVAVETRAEWDFDPGVGRFARIVDPEGSAVELWEPGATA